ncbi:MAG: hypothetical protein LQ340_001075 [Diploschistes diacapsis]|nr:MAG: hypothetical protein LQ340_001075 [Diploschistes diacapsis]
MHIEELPNELLLDIFFSCRSVKDVLALGTASRHFYHVFSGSKKLPILFQSAEVQYGPLEDAIQVVTYNHSQPAHRIRKAPLSLALLHQLIDLGKSAAKWIEIYPSRKWKDNFEDRRLLRASETYRLRRAVYRLTLYTRAFHNARYPRTSRMQRHVILERASLLHNWSTAELAEIEDIRVVLRDVIESRICPSNGTIQRKFRKRFPDSDHQLLFNLNIHLNYPPPPTTAGAFLPAHFHSAHQTTPSSRAALAISKYATSSRHEPGAEGWGDDIPHYYIVEDMLKLEPAQVLWLKENAPLKGMVQAYTRNLGDWFENNGETFGQTFEWVAEQRGEEIGELREGVEGGSLGVVTEA